MAQKKKQIQAYFAKKKAVAKSKRKIRGKGDYIVDPDINKSLRSIGRTLGQYFGQGDLGSDVANVGHRMFKQITGYGDYKIKSNTVLSGNTPLFGDGKASVRVQHREFLGNVKSSTSFASRVIPVQPGLIASFPWLSQLANNYQEYKIHGLIFEFVSRSADALNSTNTALGSVMMGVNYNCLATTPSSKTEMLNLEFSGVSKPSENLMVPLECDPKQSFFNNLFIRTNKTPSDQLGDRRLYDFANFVIATEGSQAASDIGDLYVTYDISLYKAKIAEMSGYCDHFEFAGATTSAYFGGNPTLQDSSNFGCELNATQIILPDWYEGQVMISYIMTGDSTAHVAPTLTPSGGVSALNIYYGDSSNYVIDNVTSVRQICIAFFDVVAATTPDANLITFSDGTLVANQIIGDLYITTLTANN